MTSSAPGAVRRAAARLGLVAVMLVGATGLTATSASAHHPEITATADCHGVVSFTSTAWETSDDSARTNARIEIAYQRDGGDWQSLPWQESYHYDVGDDFSFSDTITLDAPLPRTVTLKATAVASWANGQPGGSSRTAQVSLPTGCSGPTASVADAGCDDGGAKVSMSNSGSKPVTFTVSTQVGDTREHSRDLGVEPGATREEVVPVDEDATVTVIVTVGDETVAEKQVSLDCGAPAPRAGVSFDCAQGTVVRLDNAAGTQRVTFTVTPPSGEPEQVDVAAAATEKRTYPVVEDETSTVTVEAPGIDSVTRTVSQDCAKPGPAVDATASCGGFVVTLDNNGDEAAVYTVTLPDGTTEEHTVEPGEPLELTYLAAADGRTLSVAAEGMDDVVVDRPTDCEQPPASDGEGTGDVHPPVEAEAGGLAQTGATTTLPLVGVAALLLLGGSGAMFLARRRRGDG